MKVALVQRILAPYRVPVFVQLDGLHGIDVTVFYGRGRRTGPWQNAPDPSPLRARRLFTLSCAIRAWDRELYLAMHPTLPWHISRGGFDVILAEGTTNLLDNLALLCWARMSRAPLVFWDAGRPSGERAGPIRRFVEPVARALLRRADAVVTYGDTMVDYFLDAGVPREAIFVARNTVDLETLQRDLRSWEGRSQEVADLRSALGLDGRRIVLHVGSVQRNKPLDPLLSACGRLHAAGDPMGCLIIGDGADRQRLEALPRRSGFDGVRFLGRVTEDLGRYTLMSDLAVFPHGATLGIQTALAYGLPVVAGRGRSPEHEAIVEGFNGVIVPPGDGDALARAMSRILRREIALADPSEIRRRVLRDFPLAGMVEQLRRALDFAVRRGSGAATAEPAATREA